MAITINGKPSVDLPAIPPQKIAQVVSVTTNAITSVAAGAIVNATGLSVTITPTSATSKILVMTSISCYTSNGAASGYQISALIGVTRVIASTTTTINEAITGSYFPGVTTAQNQGIYSQYSAKILDEPNTTSPVTYNIRGNNVFSIPLYNINSFGTPAQIIVMEILA